METFTTSDDPAGALVEALAPVWADKGGPSMHSLEVITQRNNEQVVKEAMDAAEAGDYIRAALITFAHPDLFTWHEARRLQGMALATL